MKEMDIYISLNLDGSGKCDIFIGIGFFDYMLEQIGKYGGIDLIIKVKGDLEVDEYYIIEDIVIVLGECIYWVLGSKCGIECYGYCLFMDDCFCWVVLDFGGRVWLVWDVEFYWEKIGEMFIEMFFYFFKLLSDVVCMNLNIKVEGQNEYYKIEGIFKVLVCVIKMVV